MLLTIVVGILVLSVLILAHELGHFIMAKATHCWVEEFGIGFPPRLWGKKIGDTIYSINWIPFGGFNKISGEVDPAAPRALAARKYWIRILVLSGGILMNLILPFVLMAIAYMVPHDVAQGQVVVAEVAPNSPAAVAGIQVGDTLLTINDIPVDNMSVLSREVQLNLGAEISIGVQHADASLETVRLVPRWKPPEGEGAIGIASNMTNYTIVSESLPFWRAIPEGASSVWDSLILYKNGIIEMFMGAVPFTPSGPIGIIQVTGEVAHAGVSPVLELTAFISIAIAVTQLIPFPALDGSHLLFVIIEWLRRGKRVSPRTQTIIHSTGFIVLLVLMLVITYQDIARWVSGGSILGG
jgi:regulator of sigma E protease